MKIKPCFLALFLVGGFLPSAAFNTDIFQKGGAGGKGNKPRVQVTAIPPVKIEIESGMIHVLFTRDLGVVKLQLQDEAGDEAFNQAIDTSEKDHVSFNLSEGVYALKVIAADETVVAEFSIDVPSLED